MMSIWETEKVEMPIEGGPEAACVALFVITSRMNA